jgi:hypothetical protein
VESEGLLYALVVRTIRCKQPALKPRVVSGARLGAPNDVSERICARIKMPRLRVPGLAKRLRLALFQTSRKNNRKYQ